MRYRTQCKEAWEVGMKDNAVDEVLKSCKSCCKSIAHDATHASLSSLSEG